MKRLTATDEARFAAHGPDDVATQLTLLDQAANVAAAAMLALRARPPEEMTALDGKRLHAISEHLMETRRRCYTMAVTLIDGRAPKLPRWEIGRAEAVEVVRAPVKRSAIITLPPRKRKLAALPTGSRIVAGKTTKQIKAARKFARLTGR